MEVAAHRHPAVLAGGRYLLCLARQFDSRSAVGLGDRQRVIVGPGGRGLCVCAPAHPKCHRYTDAPEINHVRLSDLGIGEQQFSDWTQTTGAGRPDFRAVVPAAYG